MTVTPHVIPITMEELTNPAEAAAAKLQREQFAQNAAWLQDHAREVYSKYRGKCICVAGQQVFVADTAREALAKATSAYPHDRGRFVHYIPKDQKP